MDELPEKTSAPNLPLHDVAWSNESMQSAHGKSVTSYEPAVSGRDSSSNHGRTAREDREVGLALTDALADILSTEKAPRQRRNVS